MMLVKSQGWILIAWTLIIGPMSAQWDTAQGPVFPVASQGFQQEDSSIAYNSWDDEYLVVRTELRTVQEIWATRLSSNGDILDDFRVSVGVHHVDDPCVVFDPILGRYLVVWGYDFSGDSSDWDIHGRLIPRGGPSTSMAVFGINAALTQQSFPQVSYNSNQANFFVVWEDGISPSRRVLGQRLDSSDGSLIGQVVEIASGGGHDYAQPDMTYLQVRNEYFVVYSRMDEIWGRRVSATGGVGGEFRISITGFPAYQPTVAASDLNDRYVVAWVQELGNFGDIVVRWISGEGAPGTTVVLSSLSDNIMPDIDYDPGSDRFLLVWSHQFLPSERYGIAATMLDSQLALGPAFYPMPNTGDGEWILNFEPAVAAGQQEWLITWSRTRQPSGVDVYGRMAHIALFNDGFESGDTSEWSAASP